MENNIKTLERIIEQYQQGNINTIHSRIGDQIKVWDKKYDEEKYHA